VQLLGERFYHRGPENHLVTPRGCGGVSSTAASIKFLARANQVKNTLLAGVLQQLPSLHENLPRKIEGECEAQLSLQTAKDISHGGNVLSFKGGATKPSAQALQNGSPCSSRVWTRCVSIGKSDLWSREELSLHLPKNGGCSNRFSGSLTALPSTFVLTLATSSTVFTKMVTVKKACNAHNNNARFAWHRAKLGI
jgi:hypothetical protein